MQFSPHTISCNFPLTLLHAIFQRQFFELFSSDTAYCHFPLRLLHAIFEWHYIMPFSPDTAPCHFSETLLRTIFKWRCFMPFSLDTAFCHFPLTLLHAIFFSDTPSCHFPVILLHAVFPLTLLHAIFQWHSFISFNHGSDLIHLPWSNFRPLPSVISFILTWCITLGPLSMLLFNHITMTSHESLYPWHCFHLCSFTSDPLWH